MHTGPSTMAYRMHIRVRSGIYRFEIVGAASCSHAATETLPI